MVKNIGLNDLNPDLLRRILPLVDRQDAGNLRLVSTSTKDVVDRSIDPGRCLEQIDARFQTLREKADPPATAHTWHEAYLAQCDNFERYQSDNPVARGFLDKRYVANPRASQLKKAPIRAISDPHLGHLVASSERLFAQARTLMLEGRCGRSSSYLNLISMLPWAPVFADALAEEPQFGCRAKPKCSDIIDFLTVHCPLGIEICLRKLQIIDWRDLPKPALHYFLNYAADIVKALPEYAIPTPFFIQTCASFTQHPVAEHDQDYQSAMKRAKLILSVVEGGHLSVDDAETQMRSSHHHDVAQHNSWHWLKPWQSRERPESSMLDLEIDYLRGNPIYL